MATTADDGYRLGLRALDEEVDADLPVTGAVPPWLGGTLVRNGAGRWTARTGGRGQTVQHWFDGLAMLHRFSFESGAVRYANRYLRSRAHEHAVEHGEIGYAEFGTVPRRSPLERLAALRHPPENGDNACVNVLRVGGRQVAVTESPEPVAYDPTTLATLGPLTYQDDLPGVLTTAHPHDDPERGVQVNYAVEFGRTCAYHLYDLPDGSLSRRPLATIGVDQPSYMHSFALTQRYAVLVEYPYRAQPLALLAGRSPLRSYRWRPHLGTVFTVVDRRDGRVVRRARAAATFCWHHVNAFEDGDDLVVDLLATEGSTAMTQFLLDDLLSAGPRQPSGELRRYRVPLEERPVTYRLLATTAFEFPRIAQGRDARPYRWVYGVGTPGSTTTSFSDRLVKVDVETGTTATWARPGCWPGEPVPVAAPAGAGAGGAEDDGVVLSLVLDSVADRSFLLVLDAATFTEVARADLPHAVPLGFHGQHFASP